MSKPAQRDLVRFSVVLHRSETRVHFPGPDGGFCHYQKAWTRIELKAPLEGFLVRHTVLSDGYSESLGEDCGNAWTVTGSVPCWVVQPWGRRRLPVFVLESDLEVIHEDD